MEIPKEILSINSALFEAGFEAYLVGGCVRDIFLKREPKDWDIATNARPEEIQKIFPDSVYENDFGTVGVKTDSDNERLKIVEITTYRVEGKYSDDRHPDEVCFAQKIEEDLARRDFTINAMALPVDFKKTQKTKTFLIDPFGGMLDISQKNIKAVLDPEKRFAEDALRILRAVRFATELDFEIEMNTRRAIEKYSKNLNNIAKERIRDEFIKIIMSNNAMNGILLLEELGLLEYIIPELREGIGISQNKHHIFSIFEHNLKSLDYATKQNYSFEIRISALLHDIGKTRAKKGEGEEAVFYQHEYIGARMAIKVLDRLRFSKDQIEKIAHLVRHHMFYYNVGEISEAGVRRFVARVGAENIDDLLKLREADRIGSGVKKAVPYKLRHLLFMIEKVKKDPLSAKMLKINGDDIMNELKINPSPKIGWILNALLEEVLDDPKKNEEQYLKKRAIELNLLSDDDLKNIDSSARVKKSEVEAEEINNMKNKYFV